MSLTYITDHVARAKARIIQQYKGKPNIEGTIAALVGEIQNLEDTLHALQTERSIETAEGAQLDGVGQIVGQAREPGQNDADYLISIKSKIVQNLNEGTPEEVIAAAKFFLNASSVWYREVFPAEVDIMVPTTIPIGTQGQLRSNLERFLPAAVSLGSFGSFNADNPLLFDRPNGFGDVNDVTKGGWFANVIASNDEYFSLQTQDGDTLVTEDGDTLFGSESS